MHRFSQIASQFFDKITGESIPPSLSNPRVIDPSTEYEFEFEYVEKGYLKLYLLYFNYFVLSVSYSNSLSADVSNMKYMLQMADVYVVIQFQNPLNS